MPVWKRIITNGWFVTIGGVIVGNVAYAFGSNLIDRWNNRKQATVTVNTPAA